MPLSLACKIWPHGAGQPQGHWTAGPGYSAQSPCALPSQEGLSESTLVLETALFGLIVSTVLMVHTINR